MTPKADLFELIKSLTESEIKAFRNDVQSRKGKHTYILVFDAINELSAYDEAVLKKKFTGTKTLNNFSIAKSNLYEKLLEVMCLLPHHQTIETRFDRFRQQIAILVKKSLYKQAMSRVRKAIRIAEKLEAYRKVFDLHDLQREIARNFLPPQDYLDLLKQLRHRESWLNEVEQNLQKYKDLFDTASIAQKIPSSFRLAMINSILNHSLMQDESECRSTSAKLYFFRIWNHLYFIQGKDTGWKFFTPRIIELLESNDHLLSDPGKFLVYVNTISDLGLNGIASNEHAVAMEAAEKLRSIRKNLKTGDSEALIFSRYWKLQLLYCQKNLDEKNGLEAVKAIKDGLRRYKGKLSKADAMELTHIVSVFLLSIDKSSEAIHWILQLREEKLESSRPDLHFFSWLLFLVAHYNLGHIDVVEQQIPGTLNYMREKRHLSTFNKLVVNFFKKAVLARNRSEEISRLEGFRADMNNLLSEAKDSRILEYFNFIAWIDSRIEKLPLRELLKRA